MIKFKFILFMTIAGFLATACAKSGDSPSQPTAPAVGETAYKGTPGEFAALYTGTCTLQTATRSYTNCSTLVRIKHVGHQLSIHTRFFLNPSAHVANEPNIDGHGDAKFDISGPQLLQVNTSQIVGLIGADGFEVTQAGASYHFSRVYLNKYEFVGTFTSDSGQVVLVSGNIQRGSLVSTDPRRVKPRR